MREGADRTNVIQNLEKKFNEYTILMIFFIYFQAYHVTLTKHFSESSCLKQHAQE